MIDIYISNIESLINNLESYKEFLKTNRSNFNIKTLGSIVVIDTEVIMLNGKIAKKK